jgi:hypothetical protein
MFDRLKNLFNKKVEAETPPPPPPPPPPKKPRKKKEKTAPTLSEKERATLAGKPWVGILSVELDPANINSGGFTLDWNDKFIINLIKSGYKQRDDDTDQVIVDRWFTTVCRNVALELYEQQVADPVNRDMEDVRRIFQKDLGNGRTEVS